MTRKIPLSEMGEGIRLALETSHQKLSDAKQLISVGSCEDAVILIQFALEEFGKAVGLKEKLERGIENVEDDLFRNHIYKENKAWSVLPGDLKTIYEGTFSPQAFSAQDFDVGKETISHHTRVSATFVDWINGKWVKGIQADPKKLLQLITELEKEIRNFKIP
jgi:AbiV family abortive infection protein